MTNRTIVHLDDGKTMSDNNQTLTPQHVLENDVQGNEVLESDELADDEIAKFMNPAKLEQILNHATAFLTVNSEDLDAF